MGKKIFLLFQIITISFCSCLGNNKIDFQLIDAKTNEPIKNEELHLTKTTMFTTHSFETKIIGKYYTDENGYFSIENKLPKKEMISLVIKSNDENILTRRELSQIRFNHESQKLKIIEYIDGYTHVIGNYDYDLETKIVTHNNYYRDTTSSEYERIIIKKYSKSKNIERQEKIDSLLSLNLSSEDLLNNIWNIAINEVTIASQKTKRTFEEIDLLTGYLSGSLSWAIFKKQEIDVSTIFKIIDENLDIRKEYNFLNLACVLINQDLIRNVEVDKNKTEELLIRINNFISKNTEFINNKNKYFERFRGNHCHHLQRAKGELIIRMDETSNKDLQFTNCCKVGK